MERKWKTGSKALFALYFSVVVISLLIPPSDSLYSEGIAMEEGDLQMENSIPDMDYPSLKLDQEDMKEVPTGITGIFIFNSDSGKVFPNTPFILRVVYASFSPKTLTIILDDHLPEGMIIHDIQTNSFIVSDELKDIVELDIDSSKTSFNSTRNEWETDMELSFTWEIDDEIPRTIQANLETTNGYQDSMVKKNAYTIEKDIRIIGEILVDFENPDYSTPDNYVKGGSFIKIHGLSVVFEDSHNFHPHPDDIKLGVEDTNNRIWEYYPERRSDLKNVQFSLMVPRMDGENTFEFKILQAHPSSKISGSGEYGCIVDSTHPNLGDINIDSEESHTTFDIAVSEKGSGVDMASLRYRITDLSENIVMDWKKIQHPIVYDNRISFDIEGLDPGKYEIELKIKDRVSNTRSTPKSFYFTTFPLNYHDISVDPIIYASMDPVIEGNIVHFRSTIFNNGDQDEMDLDVEINLNGNAYKRTNIQIIPPGGSREVKWEWEALGENSIFQIILDPSGKIDDISTDDNSATIVVDPQYRDLSARNDYLIPSDWNAHEGEVITLSFMINNIGSISTDQFKVRVMEEGEFLGQYVIPPLEADRSIELKIDWIVSYQNSEIILHIDPLNEIVETVEWNNVITLKNPFFIDPVNEPMDDVAKEPSLDNDVSDDDGDDGEPVIIIDGGGTIWKGPERDQSDDFTSLIPSVSESGEEPPMQSSEPNLIPIIVPSAAITVSLMILGGAMLAFRFEPFRYKWVLALIPLYSKLKRSNIEKGLRYEILGYLKARPGANYSELKRNLDLNDGTLVHHLRVLEREDKIYSKKMGKYKLFYVSSYRRQSAIEDYISPFHKRILEIISSNPGIVPKKLSMMLDRSQTDISYHLSELSRNGYLEKKKKGRNSHYYINSELVDIIAG